MRPWLLSAFVIPISMAAQPYAIGDRTITFFDASRNRDVATEIHYPAVSAGTNSASVDGQFPVLVIGHGFVMSTTAYSNLWQHFVPRGYIVALPTTEGSLAPDHADFGADLAFVAAAMQAANADVSSPFHQHVASTTALMGHSMGGGASFLAAANNTGITTLVNFAAAETNPSAIAAAAEVLVPTLVFAGSNDCITPLGDHQLPMYEALTVPCRALVNITGGGHCYFAESNFNCSFGELTCSPSTDITRTEQHDVVNDLTDPWLDHFLKADVTALATFLDSLSLSTRVVGLNTCSATFVPAVSAEIQSVWPVPVSDMLHLTGVLPSAWVNVLDGSGRVVIIEQHPQLDGTIDLSPLAPGTYTVLVRMPGTQRAHRAVVAR